ncbi:MAG: hypothetical protein QM690_15595 [Sphingobium sp.]
MKLRGKLIAIGLAFAAATGAAVTAAPAEARTQVYLGVGVGGPVYQPVGWRGDPYWRGGYRDWDRRGGWDRRGWRDDRWRGGPGWRGGYRERCWTEWRGGRWGRPVRICR